MKPSAPPPADNPDPAIPSLTRPANDVADVVMQNTPPRHPPTKNKRSGIGPSRRKPAAPPAAEQEPARKHPAQPPQGAARRTSPPTTSPAEATETSPTPARAKAAEVAAAPTTPVRTKAPATAPAANAAKTAPEMALPRPLTIGAVPKDFEPKLAPYTAPYRPDTILDGGHAHGLTVRVASVRGRDKRADGKVRDDDFCIARIESQEVVAVAIADGVGSADRGWLGALLSCRHAIEELERQLQTRTIDELDWPALFTRARKALIGQFRSHAGRNETDLREVSHDLGTTLVVAVVKRSELGMDVAVAAVGDSPCWTLTGRVWERVAGADDESDADGFATSDVRCLPYPVEPQTFSEHLADDQVLVLATDGFGKPLGDGTNDLGTTMGKYLRNPPPLSVWSYLVDFGRRTYGDDRTIAAIWASDPSG